MNDISQSLLVVIQTLQIILQTLELPCHVLVNIILLTNSCSFLYEVEENLALLFVVSNVLFLLLLSLLDSSPLENVLGEPGGWVVFDWGEHSSVLTFDLVLLLFSPG